MQGSFQYRKKVVFLYFEISDKTFHIDLTYCRMVFGIALNTKVSLMLAVLCSNKEDLAILQAKKISPLLQCSFQEPVVSN